MGNGSPRLLRHLLALTAALTVVMLVFAPPAFADAGLVSAAGAAAPDPAVPSVGVEPQSAVQAAAAIPTPATTATPAPAKAPARSATHVATPQIPVKSAISTRLATSVAKV